MSDVSEMSQVVPVRVELNHETKTATIIVPWHELSKMNGDELLDWLAQAAKVRDGWRAKGYKCT